MSASFCASPSSNSSIAKRRMVERRIRAARFPAVKSFDTFDFTLELARCEYIVAHDNVIALGNSGTGKTHACLALDLAACQRGFSVAFFTAAGPRVEGLALSKSVESGKLSFNKASIRWV